MLVNLTNWIFKSDDMSKERKKKKVHYKRYGLRICYLFLQLFHKANRVRECLSLVTSQRLQVQDGLCALGLQDSDGLQQPLVTDTEGSDVRQGRTDGTAYII